MIVTDGLKELNKDIYTRVAIGKFDGVHLGHRKLINDMVSKNDGIKSLVFTFSFASPYAFSASLHIYSEEQRREIFEELGVDYLVEYYLSEEASKISPEDFVREILVKRLHAKEVYCGPDLSFGYKGAGNIDTIKALSEELDLTLHVIEKEKYLGEDISSTRIRNAYLGEHFDEAKAMLGQK